MAFAKPLEHDCYSEWDQLLFILHKLALSLLRVVLLSM